MAKFVKIARVALRSKREYLEKIGVPAEKKAPVLAPCSGPMGKGGR